MQSYSRLNQLKLKQQQLTARIQQLEASQKTKERKADVRRKILIGAYYLDKARKENSVSELNHVMQYYLTRDIDKKLFVLEAEKKQLDENASGR